MTGLFVWIAIGVLVWWLLNRNKNVPPPPRDPVRFPDPSSADGDSPQPTFRPFQRERERRERPAGPASADAYDAPDVVGLSPAELLARARGMRWNWGFWWRRDLIPPTTDERTQLIDEGMITYGVMSRERLVETHRVGDLWLKYHPALLSREQKAIDAGRRAVEKRREEKKAAKEKKRAEARARAEERRNAIEHRRLTDIVFLGRGVSSGLSDRRSNVEKLQAAGLPVLSTPADVASAIGITVPALRWLCFHRDAVQKSHYAYSLIPKRSGGTRLISSPKPKLRKAQEWVLASVLKPLEQKVATCAHGFLPGRSTVTNAREHLGKAIVVNLDLSNFFPSIGVLRVRGLFQRLGYSPAVATVLALLCTEPPRRRVVYDGISYWVAAGERGLPQGACTSPLLSNVIARTLDRRLTARATKLGFHYTRYADDLTFSAPTREVNVGKLMAAVRHTAKDEGFALNEKKGRVQRRNRRQSVTGVVVNDKLAAPRDEIRRVRAALHQAKKKGIVGDEKAKLRGKIAYFAMIDPKKAEKLLRDFERLP